ncbi:MAG: hypothetical protein R2863_11320 [Candidatus Kapaibacterium sp.]|nr:hypothetical protein [Ignavibacteriota bacterium]MCB9222044.1 hypothetical protein [Ignavibacteria bacterium]
MAITLRKEELSFGYNYIIGRNIDSFKNILSHITDLKELENFLIELNEFYYHMPETEDIFLYSKEDVVLFEDVKNPNISERNNLITKSHNGGDQQFIISSLAKKEWLYELLNCRINELKESGDATKDSIKPIKTEKHVLTTEDIYDFLKLHFKIDIKKELFISEENFSSIIISGIPNKLSSKQLTKYQIGHLFNFLLKDFHNIKNRIMFAYKGQGQKENIEFSEANSALNDKNRDIISGKTTNRNLVKFADNLEKELNVFIHNKKNL